MARGPSTRSRILEEARVVANEVGFDRLTTRELAERCGINEGNLYYYFKTKAQIVQALFALFETDAREIFSSGPFIHRQFNRAELIAAIEQAISLLREWCALSWHYRALMRDGNAVFRLAPEIQAAAMSLNRDLSARITGLVLELRRLRALSIDDDAIPPLVANIFIVSSYWLGYVIHQTGISDPDDSHLSWGFSQIMALVFPYRTWLARLIMTRHPDMIAFHGRNRDGGQD
ncbi:TetR/AcrR family transcriptional regulator [Asaia sp. As-1742]|uniref:TetR/AcrR family transcriptional regulator n=1 Tax=Asaia sp. As-1742 TaxID=2608325 RepID=UPI00141E65FF|nr:TetR/AcrR family transcriptional regulator [Asaia sp. As-1742]NIE78952.1 TetR/AcrR family transcriptional regulator [Asaia sp. As-1742]